MKPIGKKRLTSDDLKSDESNDSKKNRGEENSSSLFNPKENIELSPSTLFQPNPLRTSDTTTLQPNQGQDMSWEQVFERFKTDGELCNAQNQVLYTNAIPKELLKLIINYNGRFSDVYYGGTRGIGNLIPRYGEGVFIAYLVALKQREGYSIKIFESYFNLALSKLEKETDVDRKIAFLQVVVTMIGKLDLTTDWILFIANIYNEKNITVNGYDFCKEIYYIADAKKAEAKKAKKAEEVKKIDITYDQKTLYPQAIPEKLFDLIINCKGQISNIYYGETRGISNLILRYGEGVFITYLVLIKQRVTYNIETLKKYFELALDKLQKQTKVVKIEFLQAVITMIRELNLDEATLNSIAYIYNKKNITVDGYDFRKEIDKLKQSKHEFTDTQSAIDPNVIPVVDTQ